MYVQYEKKFRFKLIGSSSRAAKSTLWIWEVEVILSRMDPVLLRLNIQTIVLDVICVSNVKKKGLDWI